MYVNWHNVWLWEWKSYSKATHLNYFGSCFTRFYPLPFPTAPQSSARAVSTQLLNERMKEMSERIEAMDQITHNMDREFKSSRVVRDWAPALVQQDFWDWVRKQDGVRCSSMLCKTLCKTTWPTVLTYSKALILAVCRKFVTFEASYMA